MSEYRLIKVDGSSELFDKTGMWYKEFLTDYRQVRFYSLLVVQRAPAEIRELNLLEQQVSELIKNAVRHGNQKDHTKMVKVWYSFSQDMARVIVEDEGDGFQDIDKWNEFNKKRTQCFEEQDFDQVVEYFSYRTPKSTEEDGGNALFAALEYWDVGVVFNETRNAVAVARSFKKSKRLGLVVD